MTRRQRRWYWVVVALWVGVNGYFWTWWLGGHHVATLPLFVMMSLAVCYVGTFLSSMYLLFVGHMRRPIPVPVQRAEDAGVIGKVAVISLTVPGSESLEIVRRQLLAMQQIDYPHDSWILVDKNHSPEIAELARSLGVNYFSRHQVARWGAARVAAWRHPKTKAGNVNSWLKAYGHRYSHFTQFDIDHVPEPEYLDMVLGYFADPDVKWVQAPSVYGNHHSWTARGSSEQEFGLQGPLQMGFFGFSRTPFIIGSHCTYDTAAILSIGGFQPTRAEDHLDTVCLAAEGHQGVFVPDVIAVGDGPETFETYLAQQFAWSYSMMEVLFFHMPRLLLRYRRRQAVQFLFAQTWYAFWTLSMLTLFAVPLLALTLNAPVARVGYLDFLAHSLPVAAIATIIWVFSRPWHVPLGLRLSWRGVALHVARWVVVLSAFLQVLFRVKKPYMITPKGVHDGAPQGLRLRVLLPYVAMASLALTICWLYLGVYARSATQGYLLFALQGAAIFWLLLVIILIEEVRAGRKSGLSLPARLRLQVRTVVVSGGVGVFLVATAVASAGPIIDALTYSVGR